MSALTAIVVAALGANPGSPTAYDLQSSVRQAAPIVEVTNQMVTRDVPGGFMIMEEISAESRAERARLGAPADAPARIYVRIGGRINHVFSIDPYERIRETDNLAYNTLSNLPLLAGRDKIQGAMRKLELARLQWLRANGASDVRTLRNDAAGDASTQMPEPAGWFRIPDEMPRGKSRESVRGPARPMGEVVADAGRVSYAHPSRRVARPLSSKTVAQGKDH